MTDDRWQRVKALFQAAVERPPEERASFLAAAVGDDDQLRVEIESLLAADTSADGVLDRLTLGPRFISPLRAASVRTKSSA